MKACLQWINSSVPEKINYLKCYNRMRNLHRLHLQFAPHFCCHSSIFLYNSWFPKTAGNVIRLKKKNRSSNILEMLLLIKNHYSFNTKFFPLFATSRSEHCPMIRIQQESIVYETLCHRTLCIVDSGSTLRLTTNYWGLLAI